MRNKINKTSKHKGIKEKKKHWCGNNDKSTRNISLYFCFFPFSLRYFALDDTHNNKRTSLQGSHYVLCLCSKRLSKASIPATIPIAATYGFVCVSALNEKKMRILHLLVMSFFSRLFCHRLSKNYTILFSVCCCWC